MTETTLYPRVSTPVGTAAAALILGWLGWRVMLLLELRDAWWLILWLWSMAGLTGWATLRSLKTRRDQTISLGPDSFTVGGRTVRQFQVTSVRRFADLQFRGVRIDMGPELSLAIPASQHEPGSVLAAFRAHGYPVENG